jgi:hypothetical protein
MNVVLTCLFTGCEDPQRPKGFENPDWSMRREVDQLMPLMRSIHDADVVVFHDELDDADIADKVASLRSANRTFRFERQPTPIGNIYRERWRVYRRWLAAHPEARRMWCVDGTDVKMHHYPFHHMRDGVLYTCSEENKTVALPWVVNNHQSIKHWAKTRGFLQLLNAGLCGGDRETVLTFLTDLVDGPLLAADAAGDMTDMAAFNHCVWDHWAERLVTGPRVHTVFQGYQSDNGYSWWAHR